MRRVFLLSLLLVALSLLIPWLAVTLAPAGEEASPPAPSVPVSDNVAPDGATPITALCGDALIETTMADWLPGVVAAEMPASFAPEALRAPGRRRAHLHSPARARRRRKPSGGRYLRPVHLLLRAQRRCGAARAVGQGLCAQHGARPAGRCRHGRAVSRLRRSAHPRGVSRRVPPGRPSAAPHSGAVMRRIL